jgi:threonine synthase
VHGFEQGLGRGAPVASPHTIADGLRVPSAVGDFLMLRVLRESRGTALAVADAEMVSGMRRLGAVEGISAAPESGAALVAVERLVTEGRIGRTDAVVMFNTGGALKYLDVLDDVPP